ncbi:hypothetical protein ACSVH2_02710 [Flavobacterium sp. RSB2_4_14]|uniref:hypothetical protein n=1 Tax=Flavobacterium sp. RSB2_4_14 TaxID=3447665 RepID=UPI003F3B9B92
MMNKKFYILFVLLGLIPATYWLFLTLLFGWLTLSEINLSNLLDEIPILFCFSLGICGYLGLLSMLRGLQKRYYKLNLMLLGSGLLGNILFISYVGTKGAWERVLFGDGNIGEWLIGILPNVISLTFIVWILTKMYKEKNEK